ncbi:glycosyltransferase family 2 protein, partial [Halioglobus sp.]|nr:glycosyltransferase family 2 protein [Halioglobus sp.]
HILKYAVSSVLNSEFEDWELIVVGDHCTDDTEACLAEFGDERIRFYNLKVNSGQQATPNNFGLDKARGEYLCYLNHDDMFLPSHLRTMLKAAQMSPDSIILARYADLRPDDEKPAGDNLRFKNGGPSPAQPDYTPTHWYIASSWFMPMSLARKVGSWKLENSTFVTPSQDWLFRAWRGGHSIVASMDVSVIAIITGGRKGFFKEKRVAEHQYVFEQFVLSQNRSEELRSKLDQFTAEKRKTAGFKRRALYDSIIGKASIKLGIHPNTLEMIIRHGTRGGFVKHWKRRINL